MIMVYKCWFFLICLFLLYGCKQSTPEQQRKRVLPEVKVYQVQSVPVHRFKDYAVRVSASRQIDIKARVQGYLMTRKVEEGTMVKRGDLLFQIDPKPFEISQKKAQAQFENDTAKLEEAQKNYDRGSYLFEEKMISQKAYDALKSQVEQCEATVLSSQSLLDQAHLDLSYTDVLAPFEGAVGIANYDIGSIVGPNDEKPLISLTTLSPVYVSFYLNEKDFLNFTGGKVHFDDLRKRMDFTLTLSNNTPFEQHGTLNFIDPVISMNTDSVMLRVLFPNEDHILRPGMYATMRVHDKQVVHFPAIPQSAIQQGKNGTFVYVVRKDKVHVVDVTLGSLVDKKRSIEKGLHPGDFVVTEGFLNIRDGKKVKSIVASADSYHKSQKAA